MATARMILKIRFRDLDRTKLLLYQLHELRSQMVVEANPRAADLDKIIERYLQGGDDDRREPVEV